MSNFDFDLAFDFEMPTSDSPQETLGDKTTTEPQKDSIDQLILNYSTENHPDANAENLMRFSESYLKSNEKPSQSFWGVIQKIPHLFDKIIENIKNYQHCGDQKDELICHLQDMHSYLEVLLLCQSCLGNLDHSEHFAQHEVTLKVLYLSYSHCKDSETIYGELLEPLAPQLGQFYSKMQELQNGMILHMDKIDIKLCSTGTDRQILNSFCQQLGNLCHLVSTLHTEIASTLWELYVKILIEVKETIAEIFDVHHSLKFLCSEIINTLGQIKLFCDDAIDEDEFTESLQFSSQLLKIVLDLCENYSSYLGTQIDHICCLLLELYNAMVRCSSTDLQQAADFRCFKILFLYNEPLVRCLATSLELREVLCTFNPNDNGNVFCVGRLLLHVALLSNFPVVEENHTHEMTGLPLFKAILLNLKLCDEPTDIEMVCTTYIPLTLNAEDDRMVPIYDHLLNNISAYVRKCCACHFGTLEQLLFEFLTSGSDLVSLMVVDVWTQLSRYGTEELRLKQCIALASHCRDEEQNAFVITLVKKLFKMLSDEAKETLLEKIGYLRAIIMPSLSSVQYGGGAPVLSDPTTALNVSKDYALLVKQLNSGTAEMDTKCHLVQMLTLLLNNIEPSELLTVLNYVHSIFANGTPDLQFSVLTFLKAWNKKCISCDTEQQREIILALSCLLVEALKSQNPVIKCEALNTYTMIAKTTPHRQIIQQVVRIAPDLVPLIRDYIKEKSRTGASTTRQ